VLCKAHERQLLCTNRERATAGLGSVAGMQYQVKVQGAPHRVPPTCTNWHPSALGHTQTQKQLQSCAKPFATMLTNMQKTQQQQRERVKYIQCCLILMQVAELGMAATDRPSAVRNVATTEGTCTQVKQTITPLHTPLITLLVHTPEIQPLATCNNTTDWSP
jgi:hypothetical protein